MKQGLQMNKRVKKRNKIHIKVFDLMSANPSLCGDDTHKMAAILFEKEFGISLSEEQIRYLNSLDRGRRSFFKHHPDKDLRQVTKNKLEPEDRDWFGKN